MDALVKHEKKEKPKKEKKTQTPLNAEQVKELVALEGELKDLKEVCNEYGVTMLVTADHGNADQMIADDGVGAFTQHTTFPVPVILVSEEYKNVTLRDDGVLADLAPTLLAMMKLPQPQEMTGKSLIV